MAAIWQHLLLAFGANKHGHSLAFEVRHIVGFAVFLEVCGEACEEQLALLLEDDGPSTEEDIRLHFVAVFEELDGMFELEVVVMVIRLGSETNLLDFLLLLVRLHLFLLFLLRVEELLVVDNSADRRVSGRCYLDEIEILLIRNAHSLLKRVDTLLYIVADKAHLEHTANLVINTVWILFDNSTATRSVGSCCYSF